MKRALILIILMLCVFSLSSCGVTPFPPAVSDVITEPQGEMSVTFLNAGKADCIVIRTENSTVVVDTGEEDMGDTLVNYLAKNGITRLDALVITHFDKDHIGGAMALLDAVAVDTVYRPSYYSNTKQYRNFCDALDASSASKKTVVSNMTLTLDNVNYYVDIANKSNYGANEENDYSLVMSVTYGNMSFLFAGDAEAARLSELLKEEVPHHTVLKVPHHGRYNDMSERFFEAVSPEFAVITSDKKTVDDKIVRALEAIGAKVYQTSDSDVICKTDGINIEFNQ